MFFVLFCFGFFCVFFSRMLFLFAEKKEKKKKEKKNITSNFFGWLNYHFPICALLMHSLCEKTEVTVQMPGNRRDGLDIHIRIVTQRHLFCLPFKSYYFQRLIFGFFRCGLFLLDETWGGESGKGLSW